MGCGPWDNDTSILHLSQGQLQVSTDSCWMVSEPDCLSDFLTQNHSMHCHSQISWSGTQISRARDPVPCKTTPTFDWHSSHTPWPMCISLDISPCKTPRKHVMLRWKARCLQTGKEIWYLSHQMKWTWQMYFWLKLKSWDLSCYPGDAARCTACVWQRDTHWSFEPGCGFQQFITSACLRGGPRPSAEHTEAGLWKGYGNDSFLPFPAHRPPHYQGRAMERKWMESTIFDSGLPKMVSISN